ncbi:MAG TPA: (2Fe-2S)-binding protein [Nocardioidaceae bacterium]|nr:(2Fe-2S)-binding protein [Nocardioidaceae bacterium]
MSTEQRTEPETTRLSFTLNGAERTVEARTDDTLLSTLRGQCGVTSAREACGIGICGSCTVLVDGAVASSCIMLTAQAAGRQVTTSEGLSPDPHQLSAVHDAFVRNGAFQCSFCIPGMVLATHAALHDPSVPNTVEAIRSYLAGNLCRCGSYPDILAAIEDLLT